MSKLVDYTGTLIAWLNNESREGAAATLGITVTALNNRIHTMRVAGVHMPEKPRSYQLSNIEVAQLNRLVKEHKELLSEENDRVLRQESGDGA